MTGRVVRLADFGAFVEVEPGVEGLLPLGEMSWKRIRRPDDVAQVGETLHLVVLDVDAERRRVSLSLKQAMGDPWTGAERKYESGSQVEGRVLSTTDFGAFVELEAGVEGMVHISELSHQRVNRVEDVVQSGQTHTFRVLDVDEDNHRIRLSLKTEAQIDHEASSRPAPSEGRSRPARRKPPPKLKGGLE